ncbi:MAG TPA: nucleotidyltransferase domain-containing protein [Lentimicrobium sp.]|nr:nucleotidyltransferase domain-containing protein [Lentimicrobium sp.]
MMIKEEISRRKADFLRLCIGHNVKYLYAFGSATTDQFDHSRSDIDLIVEIEESDPINKGETIMSLWDRFETFFERKVDLLTESSLKNPYLINSINKSKVLIYDGASKEIFV